jgi:hypothetical protein
VVFCELDRIGGETVVAYFRILYCQAFERTEEKHKNARSEI